jgi:hypothetical protein
MSAAGSRGTWRCRWRRGGAMPPNPQRSVFMWLAIMVGLAVWSLEFLEGPYFHFGFVDFAWYQRPRVLGPLLVAALYGGHRAVAYHPIFDTMYAEWLRRTPWQPGVALPFGAALPTFLDLLVVAALALLTMMIDPIRGPVAVFTAAAGAYALVMVLAISAAGLHRYNYALALLLGLGLHMHASTWAVLAIALAGLALAADGARESLRALAESRPIPRHEATLAGHLMPWLQEPAEPPGWVGWPYGALAPRAPQPRLSLERALLIPLVLGYLALVAIRLNPEHPDGPAPSGLGMAVGIFIAAARLAIYLNGRFWPSLDGRFRLRMFIIPRFDVVLVAPLLAAGTAVALWWSLKGLGAPLEFVIVIPVVAALWIVLVCPPTLGVWDLTGGHQLSPGPVIAEMRRQSRLRAQIAPRPR